jgi:hypothetical protein
MTIPVPALDKFTHLGELGYNQKTLQERLDKFYQDLTALNTIGEILIRALDQDMARQVLGVTSSGQSTVPIPSGIAATGTPSGTTALFGDGTWQTVTATTAAQIGLGNVDNTSDLNKPVSTATAAAITAALNAYVPPPVTVNVDWGSLENRPSLKIEIPCPNDIQLPRADPVTGVPLGVNDKARWIKKTAPSTTISINGDSWVPRDF